MIWLSGVEWMCSEEALDRNSEACSSFVLVLKQTLTPQYLEFCFCNNLLGDVAPTAIDYTLNCKDSKQWFLKSVHQNYLTVYFKKKKKQLWNIIGIPFNPFKMKNLMVLVHSQSCANNLTIFWVPATEILVSLRNVFPPSLQTPFCFFPPQV